MSDPGGVLLCYTTAESELHQMNCNLVGDDLMLKSVKFAKTESTGLSSAGVCRGNSQY